MLNWDEYEIKLIKEWCEKHSIELLHRNETHFDIKKEDLLKLLKDDILYRGNWKNDKPKYQSITPTFVNWDKLFSTYWSGLQKLGDWINAICSLRNHIDINSVTEFNLNQWRFTIWIPYEEKYIGFNIYDSKIGTRDKWDATQNITWTDLFHSNQDTSNQFIEAYNTPEIITETIEEKILIPEEPQAEIHFTIQDEAPPILKEEPIEIEPQAVQEDDNIIKWNYNLIKTWLIKGCPPVIKKQNLTKSIQNEIIIREEREEPIIETLHVNIPLIPPPKIISLQSYHHWILHKNQFLQHYWTITHWGRNIPHKTITKIIT